MSLKSLLCFVVYLLVLNGNQIIEASQGHEAAYRVYELDYLWRPFGRAHNLIRGETHTRSETSNVDPKPVVVSEPNKYENKYMDNADDLQKQLDIEKKERNKHMKLKKIWAIKFSAKPEKRRTRKKRFATPINNTNNVTNLKSFFVQSAKS